MGVNCVDWEWDDGDVDISGSVGTCDGGHWLGVFCGRCGVVWEFEGHCVA